MVPFLPLTQVQTPAPEFASAHTDHSRQSPSLEMQNGGYPFPMAHPSGPPIDPHLSGPYGVPPPGHGSVPFQRTLFEGSPAYKRRRVRSRQGTSPSVIDHEQGYRRGSPSQRSYTSDVRGETMSPRYQHQQLRKISGASGVYCKM